MNRHVLSACEPQAVFRFFEDICAIPHPSGHEGAVADYVEEFAKARGLSYVRDAADNLLLRLPASAGCEGAEPVLLQGHMDMVPEKDAGSTHNFLTDGLTLSVEDGWIRADHTTLGGDDGVAVAMMLALLDGAPVPHPALECLFTVSEETGMDGAWAFDPDAAGLTARTLINLDSESEGIITAGCSGGVRTDISLPVTTEPDSGTVAELVLDGFAGGHSGAEIHKGRSNAVQVLGQMLDSLAGRFALRLIDLSGGGKDNAIPRAARARLSLPAGERRCLPRRRTGGSRTVPGRAVRRGGGSGLCLHRFPVRNGISPPHGCGFHPPGAGCPDTGAQWCDCHECLRAGADRLLAQPRYSDHRIRRGRECLARRAVLFLPVGVRASAGSHPTRAGTAGGIGGRRGKPSCPLSRMGLCAGLPPAGGLDAGEPAPVRCDSYRRGHSRRAGVRHSVR